MKKIIISASIALGLCMLSSCTALGGTLGGAAIGGGTGYGIAKATKSNSTGTALMTVGGAVVGGVIGHEVGRNAETEADWKKMLKESKKAGQVSYQPNPDGSTYSVQPYLHTPTNQWWNHVAHYSAANGNTPPKLLNEWARDWRPATN